MDSTYNLTGTLDSLTLLDETVGTEKHDTDLAGFEVHAHTLDARGEPNDLSIDWNINKTYIKKRGHLLDQLLSLDVGHAMDTSDTVTILSLANCSQLISNDSSRNSEYFDDFDDIEAAAKFFNRGKSSRTRRKGHVQSRQDQPPPEHHGFSAQGWKRPQWERPWPQQRRNGSAWRHQRWGREQPREPVVVRKICQHHDHAVKTRQKGAASIVMYGEAIGSIIEMTSSMETAKGRRCSRPRQG